jgi:predicted lactoylglutathione lyase
LLAELALLAVEPLGLSRNPEFTNKQAVALVISDSIYAAMHAWERFFHCMKKKRVDMRASTEVRLALQVCGKRKMDEKMQRALGHGGQEARDTEDHGFMYGRLFEGPDVHVGEVVWMDRAQMPKE